MNETDKLNDPKLWMQRYYRLCLRMSSTAACLSRGETENATHIVTDTLKMIDRIEAESEGAAKVCLQVK